MIDFIKLGISGHLVVSGGTARMGARGRVCGSDGPVVLPRQDSAFLNQVPYCRRFVAEHQP